MVVLVKNFKFTVGYVYNITIGITELIIISIYVHCLSSQWCSTGTIILHYNESSVVIIRDKEYLRITRRRTDYLEGYLYTKRRLNYHNRRDGGDINIPQWMSKTSSIYWLVSAE